MPRRRARTTGSARSSRPSRTRGSRRRWSGPIDVSADKLPRFGTVPGTRIHYGAGYSGNGVGPSWLGGQILASLALGARDEWTALPLVGRRGRRLPPEPFRYAGGKLVRWGTLAVEDALAAGRRPPASPARPPRSRGCCGCRSGRGDAIRRVGYDYPHG